MNSVEITTELILSVVSFCGLIYVAESDCTASILEGFMNQILENSWKGIAVA
jgi:hypothetical protein